VRIAVHRCGHKGEKADSPREVNDAHRDQF
jgi:hypothetical protein